MFRSRCSASVGQQVAAREHQPNAEGVQAREVTERQNALYRQQTVSWRSGGGGTGAEIQACRGAGRHPQRRHGMPSAFRCSPAARVR